MTSPQPSNHVIDFDTLGRRLDLEVSNLLDYLKRLPNEESDLENPIAWQQAMYSELVSAFNTAATNYVSLAKELIPSAADQAKADVHFFPVEFYYQEVLRKIADHVRLLAQLYSSLNHPQSKSGQISTFDAIQAIISDVSKRVFDAMPALISDVSKSTLEPPVLILMRSTQFMYCHLNYVSGVGIIGVPPYALVRPYPDLPIVWHEVAGHAVAVARQRAGGALRERAEELQYSLKAEEHDSRLLWDYYRDQYKKSRSQDARVKLTITDKSVGVVGREEVRRYFANANADPLDNVDTDFDWQMRWLGEFLEDLFGLRYLGRTMRDSLDFTLTRAYETPRNIGDFRHPSPALRLKIADEYLAYNNPASIPAAIEKKTDETSAVAKNIVAYLFKEHLIEPEQSQSNDEIIKLVTEITAKGIDSPLETEPQRAATEEFKNKPAIQNAFKEFKDRSQTGVHPPNQIGAEPPEAQTPLERVRSFKFTETDEVVPGFGQPPKLPILPPPPPDPDS